MGAILFGSTLSPSVEDAYFLNLCRLAAIQHYSSLLQFVSYLERSSSYSQYAYDQRPTEEKVNKKPEHSTAWKKEESKCDTMYSMPEKRRSHLDKLL